jgi:cell division protein FtsI/penicillin-binding protein 2
MLDASGHLIDEDTPPCGSAAPAPQILHENTVEEIRRVLCDVVVRGTAKGVRSSVYNIFGKTGTAKISEGKAGYSDSQFNSSFLGGAPAESPRLVVGVFIHDPDRSLGHYGGTVSAPAARNILERALKYLQVPPSPALQPPPPNIAALLVHFDPTIYAKPTGHDQTANSRE